MKSFRFSASFSSRSSGLNPTLKILMLPKMFVHHVKTFSTAVCQPERSIVRRLPILVSIPSKIFPNNSNTSNSSSQMFKSPKKSVHQFIAFCTDGNQPERSIPKSCPIQPGIAVNTPPNRVSTSKPLSQMLISPNQSVHHVIKFWIALIQSLKSILSRSPAQPKMALTMLPIKGISVKEPSKRLRSPNTLVQALSKFVLAVLKASVIPLINPPVQGANTSAMFSKMSMMNLTASMNAVPRPPNRSSIFPARATRKSTIGWVNSLRTVVMNVHESPAQSRS